MSLLTVGYEGRSAEELVALLRAEGVATVVDVRYTPLSHKPGLSKRRLGEALAAAGIGYVHLCALGNPKENRDAFRAADPAAYDRLRERLRAPEGAAAVREVADLAVAADVALLCVEREPGRCHRRLVGEEVRVARPGVAVRDL